MKTNRNQNRKLHNFIEGVISACTISTNLMPLLPLDSTSVASLKEIKIQTKNDYSNNGRILYQTSSKLLDVFKKYRSDRLIKGCIDSKSANEQYNHQITRPIDKKININLVLAGKNIKTEKSNSPSQKQNNENLNTINLQKEQKYGGGKNKRNIKQMTIDCKLIQIVRPQYKKTQNIKRLQEEPLHREDLMQVTPIQLRTNRTYVTESSDSQDIPIVRNSINSHREINRKYKKRSISPKHEHQKLHQISNISGISKNYQTQTDHSFEIDLHSMGIVPQRPKIIIKPPHNDYLMVDYEPKVSEAFTANHYDVYRKAEGIQSGEIQQQEPWQCDQEQIEEQIRQINERLSHRAYNSQRTKTESDITQMEIKKKQPVQVYRKIQQQKKQTKTVRLSLTPVKNKSANKYSLHKKEIPAWHLLKQ